MLLLNANQVEKSFASRILFKNISFGVEDKERVGLVGPNGAGKTTLLKILAGRTDCDEGQITCKKGLKIGFLEQTPQFESQDTILSAVLSKSRDKDEHIGYAYELMARFDLISFGEDFLVRELSGGWQKRVALARELLLEPELLFLDEPTNHLDVTSILWLEEFLKSAPFSVLMITHDRLFLQRVATRIMDLSPHNTNYLLNIDGSYVEYLEAKELLIAASQRQEKVLKNTLRRETEWLRRGAKARQTKQKARIENAHELAQTVDELQRRNQQQLVEIEFGDNFKSPKKLIEAIDITKSYNGNTLFSKMDLLVGPKTRLALMGDNGAGKSTLIRILLDLEKPDTGKVKHADAIKVAYFEQNRQTLDFKKTVLRNLCPEGDFVDYRGEKLHVRSYLDRFLFFGDRANLTVDRLSGGEQARLRIAQLMLQDANVLVLDEPTNDLDLETLGILESALRDFPGAVILVTHDRYFMDAVSNKILGFPIKGQKSKVLTAFADYHQWEAWYFEELKKVNSEPESIVSEPIEQKKRLSFKEKFELENLEPEILKLESTLAGYIKDSEDPALMSNATRLNEIHSQIALLQSQISEKYERWAELDKRSRL